MPVLPHVKIRFFAIAETGFAGHFAIREVVEIIAVGFVSNEAGSFTEGVLVFGRGSIERGLADGVGVDTGKKL